MAKGLPVMSNSGRKVLATCRSGGTLSKGMGLNNSGTTVKPRKLPDWHGMNHRPMPGQDYLDAQAEKAIAGGYGRRNSKCPACGVLRSNTGVCFC